MKVFKGGYKIVSLLNIDITSDFTIPGIYDDIKDSHGKPILVSEINVGGEKMNDAYTIVKQDNTDYIIEVYGYSLTIASDDSVTVASLPEITSIGEGLTLEDGELSATASGGKVYFHSISLKEKVGTTFRATVNLFISKSSKFTDVQDIIDYLLDSDATFLHIPATGLFGGENSKYGIQHLAYYTSSDTKITVVYYYGTSGTQSMQYNITDTEI